MLCVIWSGHSLGKYSSGVSLSYVFSYTCSVNFVIVVCMFLSFPLSLDFCVLLLFVAHV